MWFLKTVPTESFIASPSHQEAFLCVWTTQWLREDLLGCSNEPQRGTSVSWGPSSLRVGRNLDGLWPLNSPQEDSKSYTSCTVPGVFDPKWVRPNTWPQNCCGVSRAVSVITSSRMAGVLFSHCLVTLRLKKDSLASPSWPLSGGVYLM